MRFPVVFGRLAEADLDQIYEFIAEHSPANAIAFVRRLRDHCSSLGTMPRRGRMLAELAGEVRTIPFENRATVFYRVDAAKVTILRIRYGGRDEPTITVSDDS